MRVLSSLRLGLIPNLVVFRGDKGKGSRGKISGRKVDREEKSWASYMLLKQGGGGTYYLLSISRSERPGGTTGKSGLESLTKTDDKQRKDFAAKKIRRGKTEGGGG